MERNLKELEAIVRNKICSVCSDRTVDGSCGLPDPADCALFALFPLVAHAIQATNSAEIEDYIQAIRKHVCSVCVQQASDGTCETRRQVRCALDAYLLLVVDAVEEATGKKFDRASFNSARGVPGMPLRPNRKL